MRKFTKIIENKNEKYYEVSAKIKLLIKCENEGEAGYQSDSILASIDNQIDFSIDDIVEVSDEEYKKLFDSVKSKYIKKK